MGTRSTSIVILDDKIVLSQMCGTDGYFDCDAKETWQYLRTCNLDLLIANLRKVKVETDEEKWEETFGNDTFHLADALAKVEAGNLTIESDHDEDFGSFRYELNLDQRIFTCEGSGYDATVSEIFDLDHDSEIDIVQILDGVERAQELTALEQWRGSSEETVIDFILQEITQEKLVKKFKKWMDDISISSYGNRIDFSGCSEGGSAEFAIFDIQKDDSIILIRAAGSDGCLFTDAIDGEIFTKEQLVNEILGG